MLSRRFDPPDGMAVPRSLKDRGFGLPALSACTPAGWVSSALSAQGPSWLLLIAKPRWRQYPRYLPAYSRSRVAVPACRPLRLSPLGIQHLPGRLEARRYEVRVDPVSHVHGAVTEEARDIGNRNAVGQGDRREHMPQVMWREARRQPCLASLSHERLAEGPHAAPGKQVPVTGRPEL